MDSWGRPSFMRSCVRLRVGDPARHAQNGQPVLSHPGGMLHLHARGTSPPEPAGKNRAGRVHRKNRRSPKRVCHRYPGKDPKPAHHIHKTPAITFTKHNHPSIRPTSNHETTINQHTPNAPTSADKPQSGQIQEMDFECNKTPLSPTRSGTNEGPLYTYTRYLY